MKIDTDLRLAIKSAEKAQPNRYHQARLAQSSAIQALLDKGNNRKRVETAKRKIKYHRDAIDKLMDIYEELGISGDLDHIRDEKAFAKAGGKRNPKMENWSYDQVMSDLSGATPKEGEAILKKLGINWK